jgi:Carboxypeptidase regulatory-like domain
VVLLLGGPTLQGGAWAQESQNAETKAALPLPQIKLTTLLDASFTASKEGQQTKPPNENKSPAIDAPKPKSLGLTVDFMSLPDGPQPQAITPAENSDSQQAGTASLSGTVVGKNGDVLEGAQVTLAGSASSAVRTVESGSNGQFAFTGLTPGVYKLTITAPGMSTFTSSDIPLHAGEFHFFPPATLSISPMTTTVTVIGSSKQLSEEQLHVAEQQRIAGIIPNFYSSYNWNAPPMLAKQKFQLSIRSIIDPATFLTVAAVAGVEQYRNAFPAYGGGIEGYRRACRAIQNRYEALGSRRKRSATIRDYLCPAGVVVQLPTTDH